MINKIAENNAKIAEEKANGIVGNISNTAKFLAVLTSAFNKGGAASDILKAGIEGQADAIKGTEKKPIPIKILEGVIDKLNALGLGI
ncbi:MAG: hypothetical protein IPO39_18930 [Bacteroidetes bacterium]|nr:hypothetical protein [Bacteroidota bacterium]